MKSSLTAAMVCAGAVVGAGFVSGREVLSFFTRYGENAWWLIALAVGVMTALCRLCLTSASGCESWCGLFERDGTGARLCTALLLVLVGGAMVSAAGKMVALMWAQRWAYPIGAVGTLMAAWLLGGRSMRTLAAVSTVMTILLIAAVQLALWYAPETESVLLSSPEAGGWAALRAVGYAAMNMTLAMGVICRCAKAGVPDLRSVWRIFGGLMALLLYLCNALYLRHPEVRDSAFPIVALLRGFGMGGFWLSSIMLYLAVFTTLAAILCALRGAASQYVKPMPLQLLLSAGLPLLASSMGFEDIVDRMYAPAGLVCLLLVFLPLMIAKIQPQKQRRT